MKRITLLTVALIAFAGIANAAMDNISKTFSLITTNSDSVTYVVRGELESVWVDNAASKTSVVTVVTDEGTMFNVTSTGDANYPIVTPAFTTTGGNASNATQFVEWSKIAVAGDLTIRCAGAADTTETNATTVKVIWKK